MTTYLVTFSDASMSTSRELCVKSALQNGVQFAVQVFDEDPLPERGCGFWKWKPRIINEMFTKCLEVHDGDIVIYADAGVEFIKPVYHITSRMDQDIFLFGNNYEHAHWCKRDVIEEVWRDYESVHNGAACRDAEGRLSWTHFSKQVQASVIFFRVSDYTRKFVKEWLDWSFFEGGRLIDDSPSRTPNHPEFREHRHDQAILTTLAYREGLKLHYWPAQYNDGAFTYEKIPEYAGDDYPILFHHHRKRNHEWKQCA